MEHAGEPDEPDAARDAQREATLRTVAEALPFVVFFAVLFVAPWIPLLLGRLTTPGMGIALMVGLFVTGSASMRLLRAAALWVLVGEPVVAVDLTRDLAIELAKVAAGLLGAGVAYWVLVPYQSQLGGWFVFAIMAPFLLLSHVPEKFALPQWRSVRTTIELLLVLSPGMVLAYHLFLSLSALVPPGPLEWIAPLVFMLLVMATWGGVATLAWGVWTTRRVLKAHLDGDFDTALGEAELLEWFARAGILLDRGDLAAMETLLQENTSEPAFGAHFRGMALAEQDQPEAAWELLRTNWATHHEPADVLIAAMGLEVGADVLALLDEVEQSRGQLERLLAWNPHSTYDACRAWAHAAAGRPADARALWVEEAALPYLPPLLATERTYLRARALQALGDDSWRAHAERAGAGVGQCSWLAQRTLDRARAS